MSSGFVYSPPATTPTPPDVQISIFIGSAFNQVLLNAPFTLHVNPPAGVADGDQMFAVAGCTGSGLVTPAGWTVIGAGSVGGSQFAFVTRTAASETPSGWSCAPGPSTYLAVGICAYRPGNSIDALGVPGFATSNIAGALGLTTNQNADQDIVMMAAALTNSTEIPAPNGVTTDLAPSTGAHMTVFIGHVVVPYAGPTATELVTISQSVDNAGMQAALTSF